MINRMFVFATVLVALLSSVPVWAQPIPPDPLPPGPMKVDIIRDLFWLDLDDAQKTKVANAIQSHQEQMEQAMDRSLKTREVFQRVWAEDSGNEAAVRQALGDVAKADGEMLILPIRFENELKGILTQEQVDLLSQNKHPGPEMVGPGMPPARHQPLGTAFPWTEGKNMGHGLPQLRGPQDGCQPLIIQAWVTKHAH